MNFQDLEDAFKSVDRSFKKVDQDMTKIFSDMNRVFDRMSSSMDKASSPKRYPWEKWFAWYPVKVKGKVQWMKYVYRRINMKYSNSRMKNQWEYGDMFDILKETD